MKRMSDNPPPGTGWSYTDRTLELLAVHCRTVAYQEGGGWECASCGEYTDSRHIPGWLERAAQMRTGAHIARGLGAV